MGKSLLKPLPRSSANLRGIWRRPWTESNTHPRRLNRGVQLPSGSLFMMRSGASRVNQNRRISHKCDIRWRCHTKVTAAGEGRDASALGNAECGVRIRLPVRSDGRFHQQLQVVRPAVVQSLAARMALSAFSSAGCDLASLAAHALQKCCCAVSRSSLRLALRYSGQSDGGLLWASVSSR